MFYEDEGTDGVETLVDTPVADAPAPEWDGAWGTLDAQDWWKAVPESARGHLSKIHEEREAERTRASYLDGLFQSDDAQAALMKEAADAKAELATLQASLETVRGEARTNAERATTLEARIAEQAADAAYDALAAKYKDIFDDYDPKDETKGAYTRFVKLIASGWSEEDAAQAARALLPAGAPAAPVVAAPPKERDVKPPPSIAAANSGGNTPSAVTSIRDANEDFDARVKRLEREAEAVENPRSVRRP